MSIFISYHPLDYDFAYKLLIYLRNLGFDAYPSTPISPEDSTKKITGQDKIIAILRPEYLGSDAYLSVVDLLPTVSGFFPVLRVPISIDEWSANVEFRPIADFTGHDRASLEANLKQLQDILTHNGEISSNVPSQRDIYLNNLSVTIQNYIRPIATLEHVNCANDPQNQLPLAAFLGNSIFQIYTPNKLANRQVPYQQSRKDSLDNIVRHYRSFIVACSDIDCSAMAFYLVATARQRAIVDAKAPIPLFLDVENWPTDVAWLDWLQGQTSFSATPIEAIGSANYAVYVYGLDYAYFKTHPLRDGFYEWLHSVSAPQNLITICTHPSNLESDLPKDVVITPIKTNVEELQKLFLKYAERPFTQFIIEAIKNKLTSPTLSYLLSNPILLTSLLSVSFEPDTDFEQMSVSEYFHRLIENLWQITTLHNREDQGDFIAAENALLKLAALATEQQKLNLSGNTIQSTALGKCIEADLLIGKQNVVRFSMPMIQTYFAAKALLQFGISTQLPNLTLDKSLHRLPQRWDDSIILFSHLTTDKDAALTQVAKFDPLLALHCITSGLQVSPHLYENIIEENLNSLVLFGDFRVDLAKLLYGIDPKVAKAIFIEILRDAHWQIRLDAFAVFTELETSFLIGLAEAISEISDTKDRIAKALPRLGADALSTLFSLLKRDDAKIRLNAVWALGELGDKAAVPALVEILRDNDLRVSKQVVMSLDKLQDIQSVPYLVEYLDTRYTTIQKVISTALRHFHDNMPEAFTGLVQKMDPNAKQRILQAVQDSTSNKLVDFLIELSRDENVDVRLHAIKALGAHPETRVISRLEDCLDDMTKSRLSKSTVNEVVSKVLSNIQKPETKAAAIIASDDATDNTKAKLKSSEIVKARLLQVKETRLKEQDASFDDPHNALNNSEHIATLKNGSTSPITDDSYVSTILEQLRERTWTSSSNAARTIREYVKSLHGTASLNVINQILETLNDSDWMIRWTGVEALGWTGNVNVVPHLVQRLTDKNWKVRIAAIRSLSEIGDKTAVAGLTVLLSDSNSVVREAAAEALGLLGGKEAIQGLESAAVDQEDFVRLAAVESLGKTHLKAAEKTLLLALKDKSEHVRWAAANGLSGIASNETVSSLVSSLEDTTGPYWEQKRICDVIVDILKQIGSDEALKAVANWGNNQA